MSPAGHSKRIGARLLFDHKTIYRHLLQCGVPMRGPTKKRGNRDGSRVVDRVQSSSLWWS
jgi:hypothetical protein